MANNCDTDSLLSVGSGTLHSTNVVEYFLCGYVSELVKCKDARPFGLRPHVSVRQPFGTTGPSPRQRLAH